MLVGVVYGFVLGSVECVFGCGRGGVWGGVFMGSSEVGLKLCVPVGRVFFGGNLLFVLAVC